jgi:hypothetical protein
MTPRGRLGADERALPIHVISFATSAYVSPPTVMVRAMGSTAAFRKVSMRRASATRQVWTAEIEVDGSLEYWVAAKTEASPAEMTWPAGGAPNAHTVLVA